MAPRHNPPYDDGSSGHAPGGDTVITRVSDILVVQAIRSWIENDPLARTGWLGALQDSRIGQSIALIHRYPTHPWSVQTLAGSNRG